MEEDSAGEPSLDRFSLLLPLPYRVSLILVLGSASRCAEPCAGPQLTSYRCLGMGCQPSVPLLSEDCTHGLLSSSSWMLMLRTGCACSHSLPSPSLVGCSVSLSCYLPPCDPPYRVPSGFDSDLLDTHSRSAGLSPNARASPAVIYSLFSCIISTATSEALSPGTLLVPLNFKARQCWRSCRDARWQVWGYIACRCVDIVCEGLWGSFCLGLYVFLV